MTFSGAWRWEPGRLLLGLLLAGGLSVSPAAAQQFLGGQELGNGHTAAVATGDIDGDGDPDLVIGNTARGGEVVPNTIWRNADSGSFTKIGSIGTGSTLDIALADIDDDGDLDLVAGNNGANTVWTNDGTGTFTDTGQTLSDEVTNGVAMGDIDDDGDLDLVVGNGTLEASENDNKVYLNDGNGNFTFDQSFGNKATQDVALADVDGDGDLDLLAGNTGEGPSERNQIWLNDNGTFSKGQEFPLDSPTHAVAFADLNGDNLPDFVEGNEGSENIVWTNDGDGTFTNTQEFGGSGATTSIALADLDGDGDPDLVDGRSEDVASRPNRVWTYDGGSFNDTGQSLGNRETHAVAVADTDGDGDLDFVAGNGGATVARAPSREWVRSTPRPTGPPFSLQRAAAQ